MTALRVEVERWPIRGTFRIARGQKTEAEVVVASLVRGLHVGRGECVPYRRYGQSTEQVVRQLEAAAAELRAGASVSEASFGLDAAATSALTSAALDLEAKETGVPVWDRLGLPAPRPVPIAWTLSIDAPAAMAELAREAPSALLKLKLAGDGDDEARIAAVKAARRDARLWVDANEGLTAAQVVALLPRLAALGVVLVEQPLSADADAALPALPHAVPLCADESLAPGASIEPLAGRYDAINVKLDKAGGLAAARDQIDQARAAGLSVALGCMVSTSLSIAPALLLAPLSDWVDLDGAVLLARDRDAAPTLVDGRLVPNALCGWGR